MTTVTSPLAGHVIGLAAVPDPVFAKAMVGPGTAIKPYGELVEAVAPVDGVITSLHAHAFVVVDPSGKGVLTHLGIDTVQLNGEGFEVLVAKGETVNRAAPMVRWSPTRVLASGKSSICPVIALEATAGTLGDFAEHAGINSGDLLFSWS